MSIWDDPAIKPPEGDYVKFTNPGDEVDGIITNLGKHTWTDGSVSPRLDLDCNGTPKCLTPSQVELLTKLTQIRPEIGDRTAIKFATVEQRTGGKTLKHFDVIVVRANGERVDWLASSSEPTYTAAGAATTATPTPQPVAATTGGPLL